MWRKLTALAALLILTSCAGSTASDFCLIAGPIRGDRLNDTAETMEQIDWHNAVGVELCGW